MIKVTSQNNNIRYILTEVERVSLASEEVINYNEMKLNELDKYVNTNIDYFTGKEVKEENIWYFNVNNDGKLFTCIYDNEHIDEYSDIEKEARYLLMWRYGDRGCSYNEIIGNYIEDGKIYTINNTNYNDCIDYLEDKYRDILEQYEIIELNDSNKEDIRSWILA